MNKKSMIRAGTAIGLSILIVIIIFFISETTGNPGAPIIQNVTIAPSIAYTNSTMNCSANYGSDVGKGNVTITWYNGSEFLTNGLIQDVENESYCSVYPDAWSDGYPCSNVVDENWDTWGQPSSGNPKVWENFSIPSGYFSAKYKQKVGIGSTWKIIVNVFNYSSNNWEILYDSDLMLTPGGISNITLDIPKTSFNGIVQIMTNIKSGDGWSYPFDGEIMWSKTILNVQNGDVISSSLTGIQAKGETWNCTINATDSQGTASLPNSTTRTIDNLPPLNVTLYNNNTLFNATPTLNWSKATDLDNDILSYNLEIYNDTAFNVTSNRTLFKITSQNYTLKGSEALIDGAYYWRVLATDNSTNSSWSDNFTITIDATSPLADYVTPTEANNTNVSRRSWIFLNVTFNDTNLNVTSIYLYNSTHNQVCSYNTVVNTTIEMNITTISPILTTCLSIGTNATGNISDGIYYYNATANDSVGNKNSTPTRKIVLDNQAPLLTLSNPLSQYYPTNVSLSLNFTATDNVTGLDICWYNINKTTGWEIFNTTVLNCANATFNVSGEGIYTLNLSVNDSINNVNSSITTFGVSMTSPAIILNSPVDNSYFGNGTNISFNYTATDTTGVDTCELWGNWTGTWHKNYTWVNGTRSGIQNFTKANLSELKFSIWNVWCNDTLDNKGWALNNFTVTTDFTKPSITINSITPTVGSQTISFSTNVTDKNIDYCKYAIYDNSGVNGLNNNITVACNSSSSSATVTAYGTYNLTISSWDKAGNENSQSQVFTVSQISPSSTTGGGGGAVFVSVIKLLPHPSEKAYFTNLHLAIIYVRMRELCSAKVPCFLADTQVSSLISTLSGQTVVLTRDSASLFLEQYNKNMINSTRVGIEDSRRYKLIEAAIALPEVSFILEPKRIDTPWLVFGSKEYRISTKTSRALESCEFIRGELKSEMNCSVVRGTTGLITVTPKTFSWFLKSFEGTIRYDDTSGNSAYQEFKVSGYNLLYSVSIGPVDYKKNIPSWVKIFADVRDRTKIYGWYAYPYALVIMVAGLIWYLKRNRISYKMLLNS